MVTIEQFLHHFRRQRRWTRELVAAIPEEYFDWAPAEGCFGCGDLVRHLMQAEVFWRRLLVAGVRGEAFDPFGLQGPPEERMRRFRTPNLEASRNPRYGASFAQALERWEEIQRQTEAELAGIRPEALQEAKIQHPLTGVKAPLWEFLLIMVEHEAHHRGQLSAYLKTLRVDQPPTLFT